MNKHIVKHTDSIKTKVSKVTSLESRGSVRVAYVWTRLQCCSFVFGFRDLFGVFWGQCFIFGALVPALVRTNTQTYRETVWPHTQTYRETYRQTIVKHIRDSMPGLLLKYQCAARPQTASLRVPRPTLVRVWDRVHNVHTANHPSPITTHYPRCPEWPQA
jgi:hypothetical protein